MLPFAGRCAILRYTRLSDEQILKRMRAVIDAEKVAPFLSLWVLALT